MTNRPGHKVARSFHVTVLSMAPSFADSNRKVEFSGRVRFCQRENPASTVVRRFESQEPTSPKIGCMGQIKRKPEWVNPSKRVGADEAVKYNNNKPSKLKKLMLRRHQKNNESEEEEEAAAVKSGEEKIGFPSLGQIKRYTSGLYDHKFGDMFHEERTIVAKSGSFILEGFSTAATEEETEDSGINMWKRRAVSRLTVDVDKKTAQSFGLRKPFTK